MSGEYQPLAAYGALADIPVEEAHFRPGVDHDDMIQAGRFGASFIQPAAGFQSLIYLHDGTRHRVLAFWHDHDSIQRFHDEQREELLARERVELPDSPWITSLERFRSGIARRQLLGPLMSLPQTDLATPRFPAAVVVFDVSGVKDAKPLLDNLNDLVPDRGSALIQQYPGFMFFSLCDFDNEDFTVYMGFRDSPAQANFDTSGYVAGFRERAAPILHEQGATLTANHGHLLGWTVRQIG